MIKSIHFKKVCFFLFLLVQACTNDTNSEAASEQINENETTTILIFKAEQQIEIWKNGSVETYPFSTNNAFPFGIFELKNDQLENQKDSLSLSVFNFQEKATTAIQALSGSDVFIFPNDARKDRYFEACLRCSYQTASIYSSLWLHLQRFEKN